MSSLGMIRSMATENSITLYWEKKVAGKTEYRIFVDGVFQGYTDKTHYKQEMLEVDDPGHELKNIMFSNLSLGRPGQNKKQTCSLQMCENITFYNISNAK